MNIEPPQYSNNIDSNNICNYNNETTPNTPPPDYSINTTSIIEYPSIILNLDSEKKKCILYNLSSTLSSISAIFGILNLFYIFYNSKQWLFYFSLLILNIIAYCGFKKYNYIGGFSIFLNLILDCIVKYIIFLDENHIFYIILLLLTIVLNIYICYLSFKWTKILYSMNNEEVLEMKNGYKSEKIFMIWY